MSVIFPGSNPPKNVGRASFRRSNTVYTYEDVLAAEKVRDPYLTPDGSINYAEAVIVQEPGKCVQTKGLYYISC